MPTIPYASGGIPIGPQSFSPQPDDRPIVTPDGRARAEALRRLSVNRPGIDYQTALGMIPEQMANDTAASAASPTVLQPGRTAPFSGRDAQSLAILDPRALQEAQGLAALDQPKKMTGSFGGKSFEMTPSARVDRNRLGQIYQKYLGQQAEEKAGKMRAEAQAGKEKLLSIPGQQLTERRGMELGTEERLAGKKFEAEAPERSARIASSQAQTAATTGAESRAAATAARTPSPEQEAADKLYDQLTTGPFAQTTQARAAAANLLPRTSYGRGAGPQATEAAAALNQPGAVEDIASDPAIAGLIERAKAAKPGTVGGFLPGAAGRAATGTAAKNVAIRAIRAKALQQGWDQPQIDEYVRSLDI